MGAWISAAENKKTSPKRRSGKCLLVGLFEDLVGNALRVDVFSDTGALGFVVLEVREGHVRAVKPVRKVAVFGIGALAPGAERIDLEGALLLHHLVLGCGVGLAGIGGNFSVELGLGGGLEVLVGRDGERVGVFGVRSAPAGGGVKAVFDSLANESRDGLGRGGGRRGVAFGLCYWRGGQFWRSARKGPRVGSLGLFALKGEIGWRLAVRCRVFDWLGRLGALALRSVGSCAGLSVEVAQGPPKKEGGAGAGEGCEQKRGSALGGGHFGTV